MLFVKSVTLILVSSFLLFPTLVSGDDSNFKQELADSGFKIVFEKYDDDNWELFSMNADGSGMENLTNTKNEHELYPQASPDGKKICFLRDLEKNGKTTRDVMVMDADGKNRKLVAANSRQPCWSPDSKKIAFVKQEFKRFEITDYVSKGLFFYDLETGKTNEAANKKIHHIYNLAWSPNGKWIITTVHGGMGFKHGIIAIEIAGTRIIDLKLDGCRPCTSSDGKWVTWSGGHTIGLGKLSFENDTVKVVSKKIFHNGDKKHTYHPDFSPDGKYIVFSSGPGGRVKRNGPGTHTHVAEMVGVRGKWHLFVKPVDGSRKPLQITFGDDSTSKEAEWIVTN